MVKAKVLLYSMGGWSQKVDKLLDGTNKSHQSLCQIFSNCHCKCLTKETRRLNGVMEELEMAGPLIVFTF